MSRQQHNLYGTSLTWAAARGTIVVWASAISVTLGQFAITYLPPLQAMFGTEAVPLRDGILLSQACARRRRPVG